MRRLWWQPNIDGDTGVKVVHQETSNETEQRGPDVKSWEEIGAEFRMMLYDIVHRFRQEIKKNR
jgi:hypothetical protein